MRTTRRVFFRFLAGACAAAAVGLRLPKSKNVLPDFDYYDYEAGEWSDLSDLIYNILPTDTPLLTGGLRAKATKILHEWQTAALIQVADDD